MMLLRSLKQLPRIIIHLKEMPMHAHEFLQKPETTKVTNLSCHLLVVCIALFFKVDHLVLSLKYSSMGTSLVAIIG